jgi:hypothetical protein
VQFSAHFARDRVPLDSRPSVVEVVEAIADDKPRIVRDDRGATDPRGPTCRVEGECHSGKTVTTVINYETGRVVTAYFQ